MAKIARFEGSPPAEQTRRHTDVLCGYRTVRFGDETLLQLDTYGSAERRIPGKTSQSLQLDATAAAELVRIIAATFPGVTPGQ